jgi:hypothetical protein
MISWIGAAFLVFGFVMLIRVFGLVERSRDVVTMARDSMGVVRNVELSDQAKEKALQKNAIQLAKLFLILAFGGATACLAPAAVLWVCDQLDWISLDSVFSVALSPTFLIVSGVCACLALFVPSRKPSQNVNYSALDRFLHRVAFHTTHAQVSLADLEDRMVSGQLAACKADRPVFITGLPRAGTTLLLECCAKLPEFAAHCYRDMPFVLIPCLWDRFSRSFRQAGEARERAHGDGMLIDYDSHEALEEVLWKAMWPGQYRADRITPWQDKNHGEFAAFFRSHMRKIILLRRGEGADTARYISKNNLNIARTGLLRTLFPDSVIVVPFRDPLHHATSLLEQHRNFLGIHQEDPFASEYMRAIGHYDFGENLRPIDFGGWLDQRQSRDPESLEFWLEYWIAAYRHLLKQRDNVVFLSYEALCQNPASVSRCLAEAIGVCDVDTFVSMTAGIRAPRSRNLDADSVRPSLLVEAEALYGNLSEAAADLQARPVPDRQPDHSLQPTSV